MTFALWIALMPFTLFIAFPWMPFLITLHHLLLRVLFLKRKPEPSKRFRWILLAAPVGWFAYGIYETVLYFWAHNVIAPIRMDIFFLAPVLYLLTLGAWIRCLAP